MLFSTLSHQDMGTVILGKLESGSISKAQQLVMMPNRVRIQPAIGSVSSEQLLPFSEPVFPGIATSLCVQQLSAGVLLEHTVICGKQESAP